MGVTQLYSTATIEEQWSSLVGPWLRDKAITAWKESCPTVILTPSRAESFYLRSRLLQEGISFLGLRFWTPSDARAYLRSELSPDLTEATQAELRLLARSCAESTSSKKKNEDQATLGSVIQEPGAFLRAYDLLQGAGWDPARHGAEYGRKLAEDFARELKKHDLATQSGLHRHLLRKASALSTPLLADLLIVGFNATHWPIWDLLRAMTAVTERTIVGLSNPRVFAEDIDQLWNSSWEQETQTESLTPDGPIEPDEQRPFAQLVAAYEKGNAAQPSGSALTFLITPDLTSQIQSIVLQVLDYLRRDDCTRLGIVFAEANALALGVASKLRELDIPLDDGTGSIQPGLFERRPWQSWLAWQQEASVQNYVHWLRACEAESLPCGLTEAHLQAREVAQALDRALGETLVDDLRLLSLHLEESTFRRSDPDIARYLRERIELPESAPFAQFLDLTRQAMKKLGWKDYLAQLEIDPPSWLQERTSKLSRRAFLEWLKESTDSRERIRGAGGNHFYGRVHLVIYAQMTGQTWSHLILTGLNEGVWPRLFEAGAFGSRYELQALNQQARELNRLGTQEGGQGKGQQSVRLDRGHCLLPQERYDLALRDLCSALDGTSHAACLTSMTTEAGRNLLPSDFLTYAWQSQTGSILDDDVFRHVAIATAEWCRKQSHLLHPPISQKPEEVSPIAATRVAYDARRDGTKPFGPYEFAFRTPPATPIQLNCKTWETALNHPASVWLEEIVGISNWSEGTLSWPQTVGTWVHRWVAMALRECSDRNSAADFSKLLREIVTREPETIRARARSLGLELYPWWDHVCSQATWLTLGLGEMLLPELQGKLFLAEYQLPRHLLVVLPSSEIADFELKGRLDLLLVTTGMISSAPREGDLSGCLCWVIDFKTGSAQALSVKKIAAGQGLQAVLYALATRAQGAASTALSLHTFDAPLKPQVNIDEVMEQESIFRSLEILHRQGIFGLRSDAENEYGFAPALPMATRFVSGTILDAKWDMVHGGDSASSGDSES